MLIALPRKVTMTATDTALKKAFGAAPKPSRSLSSFGFGGVAASLGTGFPLGLAAGGAAVPWGLAFEATMLCVVKATRKTKSSTMALFAKRQ